MQAAVVRYLYWFISSSVLSLGHVAINHDTNLVKDLLSSGQEITKYVYMSISDQ